MVALAVSVVSVVQLLERSEPRQNWLDQNRPVRRSEQQTEMIGAATEVDIPELPNLSLDAKAGAIRTATGLGAPELFGQSLIAIGGAVAAAAKLGVPEWPSASPMASSLSSSSAAVMSAYT